MINNINRVLCIFTLVTNTYLVESGKGARSPVHKLGEGHGMPFGEGRPSRDLPATSEKLLGGEFFTTQVKLQEPMVYRGMYSESPALSVWSDDYLLTFKSIPEDDMSVETSKKENRTSPVTYMPFFEFVKEYNSTDIALVDIIPRHLMKDAQIPSALQCPHYRNVAIIDTIMWFNSGSTKSVVHTDPTENLHCVISGSEKFVFIHPIYKKLVTLDGPGGSSSYVDVDAVDYDRYPGLAGVEFQHTLLQSGDCIYIPPKRIHQVNSFERTIALNFYWDPSEDETLETDECNAEFDPQLTLLQATRHDLDDIQFSPVIVKSDILQSAEARQFSFEEFAEQIGLVFYMSEDFEKSKFYETATAKLKQAFDSVDRDRDGFIEESDVLSMVREDWEVVYLKLKELKSVAADFQEFVSRSAKEEL